MKHFEHIDDYMAGKLDGKSLKEFEDQLLIDPELKQLVDDYNPIKHVSEGLLELDLLEEVKAANQNTPLTPEDTTSNSTKYGLLGLLIMAILYILFSVFINKEKTSPPPPNQFASNYSQPIWPITRAVEKDYLELGVSTFLADQKDLGRSYLLDSTNQKVIGQYWLAELYLKDGLMDSVRLYLPTLDSDHIKYNRVQKIKAWIRE